MASDNSSESESDQNSKHQQWLQICQRYNLQTAQANCQDAVAARQRADAVVEYKCMCIPVQYRQSYLSTHFDTILCRSLQSRCMDAWSMGSSRSSSEDEAGDKTGDNAVGVTVDETGEVTVDVTGEVAGEEPGNDPEQPIVVFGG
ncbi:expressed unknown protein [Seminavis robusta]|uniref:Uncharacterized protein n=1 Tax=Seminavis robusta TaxID=568900 RepID=A0A9N8H268_9STRA|nr:expressed unknown protein [Seminavis robusta]|eukprot:Sro30_g019830.1 n/a (145) ;mRNA; r:138042-138476